MDTGKKDERTFNYTSNRPFTATPDVLHVIRGKAGPVNSLSVSLADRPQGRRETISSFDYWIGGTITHFFFTSAHPPHPPESGTKWTKGASI